MKKINYIIVLLLVLIPMGLFAQSYPLRVILTSKANLSPNLGELKENPSKFINVAIANNASGAKNKKIYLELKIKQISPKQDVFVKSNKYLRPLQGMDVKANSVTQINAQQFNDNFSTHTFNDFEIKGLTANSLSDVTDLSSIFTLPEGIYQFCLIAYDFDSPLGEEPVLLSDPDASCLMVKVCYKANSPKWIEPVNCINDINCYDKVVSPARMIRFSWTPVNNSCGVNIGTVDYTVKMFQVFEGQTADEAVNINPPKYIWEKINGTNLMVDTISLQNIFVRGEKYAIQVSLDPEHKDRIAEKLVLENEGLSKAVSFFYGESNLAENSEDKENKDKDKEEKKPEFEQEIDRDIRLVVTDVDCGIALPANQIPIESLSPKDEVMIDKFPMIIKEITKNDSTKLYKGTGIIRKPIVGDFEYFNWVNVMVEFDSLAVNTDKQVFGGFARAVYSKELNTDFREFFKSFDSWPDWAQKYCGIGANKGVEQAQKSAKKYVEKFQGEANVVLQMFNLSYQTLPIKIRHNIAGYDFDVAISDMKFTPRGSAFSLLYFMKIPEVDQVLPFGIRNVCMSGNPVQNGEFCLLADVEIPIGSKDKILLLKGGQSSDNKQKTYVKWSNKGFEGVRLEAALRLYKGSGITSTDTTKQFVEVGLSTDFVSWDNWIADINMENFKIDNAPDLTFSVKNAVYDHSTSRNHSDYDKAVETLSKYDSELKANQEFTGFFFGELGCKTNIFASDEPLEFAVKNTIMNTKGISFSFDVNNILNIETGRAGGWQFSIDTMKMVLVNNIFREGEMKGKMKVPLNDNDSHMDYSCVLSYPKGKSLEYRMSVIPTIDYDFLKYFKAELDKTSSIDLLANDDGVIVTGKFNGKISTRNCKLKLDLVSFQGMTISNWNEKKKQKDFYFTLGDWGFGAIDYVEGAIDKVKQGLNNATGKKTGKGKHKKGGSSGSGSSKPLFSVNFGPFEGTIGKISFGTNNFDASSRKNLSSGLQKAKSKGKLKGKKLSIKVPVDVNIGFGDTKMAGGGVDNVFAFDVLYDASFKATPKLDGFNYNIDELRLKGEFGVVSIDGSIGFFDNDDVYGDGAGGKVNCSFPMGIEVKSEIIIGKKSKDNGKDSKYFCVYGAAKLESAAIPLAEPLVINGFGLGVWKNMTQRDVDTNDAGLSFVPVSDGNNSWGFKGQLLFGLRDQMGGKNTLAASATLNGQFTNGALDKIQFLGDVALLGHFSDKFIGGINKSLSKLSESVGKMKNEYCVNGNLDISYVHRLKQFSLKAKCTADFLMAKADANLEIIVDGINKKWCVAVGKPMYENKDSVICVSSGLDLGIVKLESEYLGYLIAGNRLEYNMPPIPEKILKLVKEKPSRQWPKRAAAGFMIGSRFSFNFEFNFGPLFAGLEAMLGFDMSFKNEKGKQCADGRSIKGMKGYYLRGQLYAYLSGKIGVQLKFFGKKRRWNLCAITCGGYLKGGLPNPTYLKGAVGVKGEILGGMIKFNTNAKFTLGRECVPPAGDPLKDFVLIEEITPGSDTYNEANNQSRRERPSVFVSPKARFTVYLNKPFDLFPEDGDKRTYIFKHHSATLTNITNGTTIALSNETNNIISYSYNKPINEISYKFRNKLEPNTMYKLEIKCRVWELDRYGRRQYPIDERGNRYTEAQTIVSKTVYFNTSLTPNRIEIDNIRDAYPYDRQFETFVRDGEKGYIVLQYSQSDLIKRKSNALGKNALFGFFKNKTYSNRMPIFFNYEFDRRNIGGNMKDVVVFDLAKLDKGCIYGVEFYVAEEFDKAATYKIVKESEKLSADNMFDDDKESGDKDVVTYTGFVDVDKFNESMKIGSNFAGYTSNKARSYNTSKEQWNSPAEYEQYLNSLDYDEGSNNIQKEKNYSARYNTTKTDFTQKSNLEKTKNYKKSNAQKAVIRQIFKYNFRTSNYNSIEDKLSYVRGYYTYEVRPEVLYCTTQDRSNRESVWLYYPRYMFDIFFPYYTTREEAFGGKAFEESSNAVYKPSNFNLRTNVGNDGQVWNIADAWQKICMPFLNSIKSNCQYFYLPFTENYDLNLNTYEWAANTFNWYRVNRSNERNDFEGRLTYDEINSGRIYRTPRNLSIAWSYVHNSLFYLHLSYAGKVADEFVNKKIGKKQNYYYYDQLNRSNCYIRLQDSYYDKNFLHFQFSDFAYKASSLLRDAGNGLIRSGSLHSDFNGNWITYNKSYDKKIRYLKKTTKNDYDFFAGGHSTLFALEDIWNTACSKKYRLRFEKRNYMYYPIGKHKVWMDYTKPIRLGYPSTKRVLMGDYDFK